LDDGPPVRFDQINSHCDSEAMDAVVNNARTRNDNQQHKKKNNEIVGQDM